MFICVFHFLLALLKPLREISTKNEDGVRCIVTSLLKERRFLKKF